MILLDTHAFIWLASNPKKLGANAKKLILSQGGLNISSISAFEISLLVRKKKLTLPLEVETYIREAMTQFNILESIPDISIFLKSTELTKIHDDPVDRVLIATAMLRNWTFVSKDVTIARYPGVRVVW